MEFKSVKEVLNSGEYWRSLLNLNRKVTYLTTEFAIKHYGTSVEYCAEDDDFYIGEFVIICDKKSKCSLSTNDYLIYDLYYKELKYSNTLYIDFFTGNGTYTKAIRMKKDETFFSSRIRKKIEEIICEFERLYMMEEAIRNYSIDNCEIKNLERKKKIKK